MASMPVSRIRFWDSHGAPWETCDSTEPGAVAFGPRSVARPWTDGPNYSEAKRLGIVDDGEDGDYPTLAETAA